MSMRVHSQSVTIWRLLLLGLCGLLSIGLLLPSLQLTAWHPVAAIDDAYIHFQYARNLAEGLFMRYNAQDAPTSGGTSLLYPLLLGLGFRLGITGEGIVWFAWLIGVISYLCLVQASFNLAYDILEPYTPSLPGSTPTARVMLSALAAILIALNGAVLWSVFSGMETTLVAALAIGTFAAISRGNRILACGLATLCALTRPEGAILALLVIAWLVIQWRRSRGADPRTRQTAFLVPLMLAGIVVQPVVNALMTGNATASGLIAKSWLYNVPFYPLDIAYSIISTYAQIWLEIGAGVIKGISPPFLAVIGMVFFLSNTTLGWRRHRIPAISALAGIWIPLGLFSVATLQTAPWHYARYQLSFIALLLIGGVCGTAIGLYHLPARSRAVTTAAAFTFFVIGTLGTTIYTYVSYLDSVRVTSAQVIAMSEWLRMNTPATARIGVHDSGAIKYLSGRYTYDVIGLTTPGEAPAWRNGPGAVYEQMERNDDRPTWFATYPEVQSFSYFRGTDFFATQVAAFPLTTTRLPTIVSAGEQRIFKANWRLLNSGNRLYQPNVLDQLQGLELTDAIDVSDLVDEQQHQYHWWNNAHVPGFPSEFKQLPYRVPPGPVITDGGRLLTGGEEMRVRTHAGADLWIVLRVHPQNGARLRVYANNMLAGLWVYPQVAGFWLETLYHIPASMITSDTTHLRLEPVTDDPGFRQHTPFYYWFYQGRPTYQPHPPAFPVEASLGSNLDLLGYDLVTTRIRPGQPFTLTLYWRATGPIQESYKVFIHVAGENGKVQAQSDGFPVFDTRTTNTWNVGEVLADERSVTVPEDLPPGNYQLICGMYQDAPPHPRLPVKQPPGADANAGADYLLLAELNIQPANR